MTVTGHFLTSGGSVILMDIPAEGSPARERFDQSLEKGDLKPVDENAVEEVVVAVDRVRGIDGGVEEVKTTKFQLIGPEPGDESDAGDGLDALTRAELRTRADDLVIDIGDAKTKAEIIAVIRAAEADETNTD